MTARRRGVLFALFLGLAALATAVLARVLGTVFFAVTLAYLLAPIHRQFVVRHFPNWWASAATAAAAAVGFLLPIGGVGLLLYDHREALLAAIQAAPTTLTISVAGLTYVVDFGGVRAALVAQVSSLAFGLLAALPVLALKATLFAVLLFGLLLHGREAGLALLAPVPESYRDVAAALHERARATLYAIYVLQAATAVATFAVALPFFWLLDHPFPFTVAVLSGILQFIPIVGPSVVVVAVAAGEAIAGDAAAAATMLVLGLILVGWLPDALVRPRLAQETAHLPGSLYFIGFVGGLLTVGVVGIVAGPLVVALLAEVLALLAAEENGGEGLPDVGTGADANADAAPDADAPPEREGGPESG
jgi:predicted PurR-regulated permease PerM